MTALEIKAKYDKLITQQLIIADGLKSMEEIEKELNSNISAAQFWGNFAVTLQAVLVPLNIILNAFEVKAALSLYQITVKTLFTIYQHYDILTSGRPQQILEILKKSIIREIEKKGLTELVPVANIFIGLAQDTITLHETASSVLEGSSEQHRLRIQLSKEINKAKTELLRLQIESDSIRASLQKVKK